MTLLDQSILESPVTASTQDKIASRFWGSVTTQPGHLRPYFQYYTEQCRIIFQSYKSRLPIKTHADIVDIAADIVSGLPRAEVKGRLGRKYNHSETDTDDVLDACIDLSLRLIFMLDAGEFQNTFSGREKLVWTTGTIHEFMRETFPEKIQLNHDGLKLGRGFDVSSMIHIAGFNVELTTNLADHLRLHDAVGEEGDITWGPGHSGKTPPCLNEKD
ncbi:hypothetical protein BDW75DRAFT_239182 [Aspergillus navahoensis]